MTDDSIKIIFIHGNGGGRATDHWFPWAKTELDKLGIRVIAKDFPDSMEAKEKVWIPFIKELGADENTIIVGHSSGAVAAMRYAENNKILGSVLTGACYTDLGEESEKISGYYDHPWNWDAIKNNQKWIVQFASTDDPYIPIEEARFINKALDTEYYEYSNRGHFGWDKKEKTFPELIDAIKRRIK